MDFRDRIDHWKWLGMSPDTCMSHDIIFDHMTNIGNKRDSNIELLVLCNHWFTNLNRALVSHMILCILILILHQSHSHTTCTCTSV